MGKSFDVGESFEIQDTKLLGEDFSFALWISPRYNKFKWLWYKIKSFFAKSVLTDLEFSRWQYQNIPKPTGYDCERM